MSLHTSAHEKNTIKHRNVIIGLQFYCARCLGNFNIFEEKKNLKKVCSNLHSTIV